MQFFRIDAKEMGFVGCNLHQRAFLRWTTSIVVAIVLLIIVLILLLSLPDVEVVLDSGNHPAKIG
jgi:hypothetical protein